MYKGIQIEPPFFEIGPKAYLYGREMVELAMKIDKIAAKYRVQVILTPQYTDIPDIARNTEHLLVFAQHMDPIVPGRGLGAVLPEAVKAAGAVGVMLNHAEKPLSLSELNKAIRRADEVGLATIVCADTPAEVAAVAKLEPNIVVAEPTELIGTGQTGDVSYVKETIRRVREINPEIRVLQGAGITCGKDVYDMILAGAEATGSSSGIFKAADPAAMAEEMLRSLREAWDKAHESK